MKKILISLVAIAILILPINIEAASEKRVLYFFNSSTCSYCADAKVDLPTFIGSYENIVVESIEVDTNYANGVLFDEVSKITNNESGSVPFFVIGDTAIMGYSDTVRDQIKTALNDYNDLNEEYEDVVLPIKDNLDTFLEERADEANDTFTEEDKELNVSTIEPKNSFADFVAMGALFLSAIVFFLIISKKRK